MRTLSFRLLLPLLLTAGSLTINAQILDDFSDGNLTENPVWSGDTDHFIVNQAGMLQLNAPDAGTSTLVVEGAIPDSAVWLLDVRLEFAPSASNLLRIFLLADQEDLTLANGYYLEIGENGTADALRFFRQDAGVETQLATGLLGFVASDPVDIQLRIRRTTTGNWTLEAAITGGAYIAQGAVSDNTHPAGPGRYFGITCTYTATRRDKFFLDNLSVLPDLPDTSGPLLLGAQAENDTTVLVMYDEALDTFPALTSSNYTLTGIGAPATATFESGSQQQVRLVFNVPLGTDNYVLTVDQVIDTIGNVSGQQSVSFSYVRVEPAVEFDVLINEIMADPSPSVGLPEAEWLELYNISDKVINLGQLFLSDGGTPQQIPDYLLFPNGWVVLATPTAAGLLDQVVPAVLAMPGFPTLNNDGELLELSDQTGRRIDQVHFRSDWHSDPDKEAGGWSLERINPGLPCLGSENWQSCTVLPGGTPGQPNAGLNTDPDITAPRLLAAFPEDTYTIVLTFSEGLEWSSASDISVYHLQPMLEVDVAEPSSTDRSTVQLHLLEPLEAGVVYHIWADQGLEDCSGNPVTGGDTILMGLPEMPAPADIVINEILFNPASGGTDFVECYNRSQKIFNLEEFFLANFQGGSDIEPVGWKRLFFPGEYLVFTSNPADIRARFPVVQAAFLREVPLPSFPDAAGNVTLVWSGGAMAVTVDSFNYTAQMHNVLLSSTEQEGVSLERIQDAEPTNLASNWTSAARSADGNGTPTWPNSQILPQASGNMKEWVQMDPARVSPDGDGFEDLLHIRYELPGPGYAATFTIFSSEGYLVKKLVRNELVGTTGVVRWEGDLEDGTVARPGIYVLLAEAFSPNGDVLQKKESFAVVRRF
ncbi:MAG: hypothetical protein EP344_08400 [Bacteroidetes bacterium]|nr:MAG: hypothetical protein EP344_08400 [Bacteroidota bacterium]